VKIRVIFLFIIIILLIFLLFFILKKPAEVKKIKETIELHEKEKKGITIKEKIVVSREKAEATDYNILLLKINSAGDLIWQKTYDNKFVDWAEFVFQTTGDDIFMICRSYDINDLQDKFFVIKTDKHGNLLWQKDFDDFFSSEEKTQKTKNGYITTGKTWTDEKNDYDVYVFATDYDGNYLWTKSFGNKYYEWGYFVLIAEDGTYLIGEDIDYPGFNNDFYLKKKDFSGKNLWLKSYGLYELNKGYAMIKGIDNGYILTGVSYLFKEDKSFAYLLKVDSDGNKVWEKVFKSNGYNEIFSIAPDVDGYLLAGTIESKGDDLYNAYLIKTDINGNKVWEKTFGSNGNDAFYSVCRGNDNSFLLSGITQK
jgi:hypothetical protein